MLAALGANENLNVSDLQFSTWNIVLLRRPWRLTWFEKSFRNIYEVVINLVYHGDIGSLSSFS